METSVALSGEGKAICWYLVACVDLLGHSNELAKMTGLPVLGDEKAREAFLQQLKSTYGRVNTLHQSFKSFFETKPENDGRWVYTQIFPTIQIRTERFMDTVFIYLPLMETGNNTAPVSNIYRALTSCASVFLVWLSEGMPVRGGIDIGVAFEPRENEIYGPAVMRAYHLESRVAQYPRIVVGQELLNYLKSKSEATDEDPVTRLNKASADLCFKLLVTDLDGLVALDYLGQEMRNGAGKDLTAIFENAQRFVLAESEKQQHEKNTKLAIRYTMLRSYFASRQALWQVNAAHDEKHE